MNVVARSLTKLILNQFLARHHAICISWNTFKNGRVNFGCDAQRTRTQFRCLILVLMALSSPSDGQILWFRRQSSQFLVFLIDRAAREHRWILVHWFNWSCWVFACQTSNKISFLLYVLLVDLLLLLFTNLLDLSSSICCRYPLLSCF